jgi:hypothetical protein
MYEYRIWYFLTALVIRHIITLNTIDSSSREIISFITADAITTTVPMSTQIYIIKCYYDHNVTNSAVIEKLVTLFYAIGIDG